MRRSYCQTLKFEPPGETQLLNKTSVQSDGFALMCDGVGGGEQQLG